MSAQSALKEERGRLPQQPDFHHDPKDIIFPLFFLCLGKDQKQDLFNAATFACAELYIVKTIKVIFQKGKYVLIRCVPTYN